jgi:DNA repair protein RadA/Sms
MFICGSCGYKTLKWMGKCPDCKSWDSLEEVIEERQPKHKKSKALNPKYLSELSAEEEGRFTTGISEFDRVMGGGVVPGSLTLISGDPGIGKSTLLLMVSGILSRSFNVFYVSGE